MTESSAPPTGHGRPPLDRAPRSNGLAEFAKDLLPGSVLDHLRALLSLSPPARWTYLRCRLRRRTVAAPSAPASVLFICHGNIIRSAMAEHLLRLELSRSGGGVVDIRSAGIHARPGRPADSRAIEIAPDFGVSLMAHHASALTTEAVQATDLIIVMDFLNEAELLSHYPSAAPRVRLMGEYLDAEGTGGSLELPDPYMQDAAAVRACFVRLQKGIQQLVAVHGLGSSTSAEP